MALISRLGVLACALLWGQTLWGQVVINEIHYAPADRTSREEFVELFNAGAAPVDLSGWTLSGGIQFQFAANTVLGAAEFLVVAQDPAVLAARFGGVVAVGPFTGRLGSDGETLILRSASGRREDVVDYQRGFPWPTAGGSQGYSIELIHPALDNELGGSWRIADKGGGAQTTLVAAAGSWRYRKGTQEASAPASAWREPDFNDAAWTQGTAPFGYGENFVATTLGDMQGGYSSVFLRQTFEVDDPSSLGRLTLEALVDDGFNAWLNGVHVTRHNLAADELGFDGTAIAALEDLVFQSFDLPGAEEHLVAGTNVLAIQLHNSSLGSSSDAFLDARLLGGPGGVGPSPGRQNIVYDENAPPILRQVEHFPAEPRTGEGVVVTVKATDADGVASIFIEYQIVAPGAYVRLTDANYETGWIQIPLRDDGAGPDDIAADGVFAAEVPAAVQTHRRLVRYRLTATDTNGKSVRVPYADDPQPNFAYFVYDGVPAWRGSKQPGVAPVRAFGVDLMRAIPVYHLIAAETDVTRSQYDGGFENVFFRGTLVYDGKVYDHVEFENRGEFSTYVSGKNKWRFHFLRGHDFQAHDNFGRPYRAKWETMNYSPCSTPWVPPNRGMAGLDEALAFRAYELAGVLAPRTNYFQFRVIDEALEAHATDQYRGDLWGLYMTNEHTDGAFLDERGLPDGNVYKIEGGNGDKRHQGATHPRTTADYDTYRNGFNAAQPITWWRANLDLDAYYSFRTIDRVVNNMDLRDGWNHCQYHNSVTNRWTAIPWDIDMLYMPTTHWSGTINVQNCILQHPALRLEYASRAREIQDLLLTEEQLGMLVDEFALLLSPPTATLSFWEVDEAMWNHHPRTASSHKGNFYRTPISHGFIGGTITRSLASPDHAGMAQYVKDFTLAGYGANFLNQEAVDPAIPNRPVITYTGPVGFPADGLLFQSSAFSDPQGAGTFGAMEWRVSELTPPDEPVSTTTPRRYEIELTWRSPVSTQFAAMIQVPSTALRAGAFHRARVRHRDNSGRWSRWSLPVEFAVGAPASALPEQALRIVEVHFHPENDTAEEFVEVLNTGAAPVSLTDVALADGVEFRFADGSLPILGAGERVVVVESLDDFRARYGVEGIRVAGEYSGRLANAGERLELVHGANFSLHAFTFADTWQPDADGLGSSLEAVDETAPLPAWNTAVQWRASSEAGGTPGRAGGGPPPGGRQKPGDSNQSGSVDLGDAISLLFRLFVGGAPLPCAGASLDDAGNRTLLDVNGSGAVNLTDAVSILNYLFLSGAPPALGTACVRLEGCPEACTF